MNEKYIEFAKNSVIDLAEFKGLTVEEVLKRGDDSRKKLNELWIKGEKKQISYYSKEIEDLYLYDLATWHFLSSGVWKWLKAVEDNVQGKKVLDFGGGVGTYTLLLSYLGFDVTFIDINPYNEEFTRWRLKKYNLSAEFEVKGKYDSIICLDTLEHLLDPVSALRNFYNLLNPGGILILTYEFNTAHGEKPMHLDSEEVIKTFEEIKDKLFILVKKVNVGLSTSPLILKRR